MSKAGASDTLPLAANWRSARPYAPLLKADRRAFAWEWLRRHPRYRQAWLDRHVPPIDFGLFAYENPDRATPDARPLWTPEADPQVLDSRPGPRRGRARRADLFDIRRVAEFVAVEVDETDTEHWLLSNGQWIVRLDLHGGTLLGGPLLLEHSLVGFESAAGKLCTIKQLAALAQRGDLPAEMHPCEPRAPRWILELRTADALAACASHQDMARTFFGLVIDETHWRRENDSHRQRIRRLVRAARLYLDDPFQGPWFR